MNIKLEKLKKFSQKLRHDTFEAFIKKGEAHLGGSFSIIEILVVLYNNILTKNDKFILSKSHASYPLCILLQSKGYKTKLTTHLEIDTKNGIHCTTGSLGHGLPIATGMALSRRKQKKRGRIFVLISDGECQEGTTWESLLIASKHKLSNIIVLIDYNKIQALDYLKDALPLNNLGRKIKSFNFKLINIKDGHNIKEIIQKLNFNKKNLKPTCVILNTIKGKGIKKFENDPTWHAKKLEGNNINYGRKILKI